MFTYEELVELHAALNALEAEAQSALYWSQGLTPDCSGEADLGMVVSTASLAKLAAQRVMDAAEALAKSVA